MERRIGRSSSRARVSASSPHGYQSTGLSACWRRYGLVSSASLFTGLLPAPHQPAHELDGAGDREGNEQREREALPRRLLELLAADVAEQRRVRSPDDRGDRVERREAAPRHLEAAGREAHRRPATGDEARDHDQLPAALVELAVGPRQPLLRLLRLEEATLDGVARPAAAE